MCDGYVNFTNTPLSDLEPLDSGNSQEKDFKEDVNTSFSVIDPTSVGDTSDERSNQEHLYVKNGQVFLKKYIELSLGPLAIGGWNTTQAETILKYFSTL